MWEITEFDVDRSRAGWWAIVLALGAAFAFVLYSFVGTFVLGIFLYYAARPAYIWVNEAIDSDGIAAGIVVFGIVGPILGLLVYAGFALSGDLLSVFGANTVSQAVARFGQTGPLSETQWDLVNRLLENPIQVISNNRSEVRQLIDVGARVFGIVGNWVLHVSLALTLAFYLLRDGDKLETLFRRIVGGSDTVVYSYLTAVDRDLETIFYGNVLFVLAVAILAAIVYQVTNFLAPPALRIPIPFVLAALTGVSALIPLIVSKVVYVPLVLYLGFQAYSTGAGSLAIPVGLLAVSLVFLDLIPQLILQPYITGRKIKMGLMLFAYIFGPLLFGWYGIFLLPLLLVLGIQAVRIVVVELIHGEPVTSTVDVEESLGSDPAAGAVGGPKDGAAERGERLPEADDGEGGSDRDDRSDEAV